ncbi:MAG TPA: transposase [Balneolaceae bacterium]|nr:transposase [Balneolaceae bacterium]
MNTYSKVYIAIDLHSKSSVIGYMNNQGKYIGQQEVATTAANLINQVTAIPAARKHLTLEQGNMAFWAARQLQDHVDELMVCDPRYNALISRSPNKNDRLDTLRLCKLLRLGELKPVWAPEQMGIRRLFYQQIKEYQRLTKTLTIHKRQIQAALRHWGINIKLVKRDYHRPKDILQQVRQPMLRGELQAKFGFIQTVSNQKDQQFKRIQQTGRGFWEIAEFQKMAGVGPVVSHTFSAYIQTPHRFPRRGQLIRFCQLGVRKSSSGGHRLRSERLDKAGHGSLKNISHVAWKAAMKSGNEVSGFYRASLQRCGDPVHARLNTQRKILISLWSLWKHKQSYRPEKFFSGNGDSAR